MSKPTKEDGEVARDIIKIQEDFCQHAKDLGIKEVAMEFWHCRQNLQSEIAKALTDLRTSLTPKPGEIEKMRNALLAVKADKGYPMKDETFELVDKALGTDYEQEQDEAEDRANDYD